MQMPQHSDVHFWLTRSVGRCMGLNFTHALEEGRLSVDAYQELVTACCRCPHVRSCEAWLGRQSGEIGSSPAPEFCCNSATLEALRPH